MNPSDLISSVISKDAGSRFQPIVPITASQGVESKAPVSFEKAFIEVATFHAAVTRVAQDAASVGLGIFQKNRDKSLTLLEPETNETARVFAQANSQQGPTEMWEEYHTFYEILGEGFLLTDYHDPPRSTPQELWALPPRKIKTKANREGEITAFVYDQYGPNPVVYDPNEIFHQKQVHPLDDFRGLGATRSAIIYAALEITSSTHWTKFFEHGARLATVIETDRKLPRARVKEYLREFREQYDSVENAFKTLLLHSGFKLRETGTGQHDVDFIQMFKLAREQQLVATGVPPALVGIFEYANYANSEQQIRIYWQNKIWPRLRKLAEGLTQIVLPRFGTGLVAMFDMNSIPAFQEMQLERAERLSKLVTGGVFTPNNARAELGLPRVSGGDGLFLPAGLAPVGIEITPQRSERVIASKFEARRVYTSAEHRRIDSPERTLKRQTFLAGLGEYEKPVLADWIRYTDAQEARVLANLENAGKSRFGIKALDVDDVLAIEVEINAAKGVVGRVMSRLVGSRGTEAAAEVGAEFLVGAPEVIAFIEGQQATESVLIATADHAALRALITDMVRENASTEQIARAIQEHYVLERFQARAISRTQTIRGYNFGTGEAWKQSDVIEKKEWLTTNDGEQRDEHDWADGEKVGINESFMRTGQPMDYPGDPAGDAWNVINCRCTMLPVTEGKTTVVRVAKTVWGEIAGKQLAPVGSNGKG
jgi:HK97 family phage portal protein